MSDSVAQSEREVAVARSRLADHLSTLRAPETLGSFTDSLRDTALETKDTLVDQTKEAVQTKVNGLVEELKAKAAANPAAAIAIGAGLAWHFVRNPPITTALIGVGLYSLWRTSGNAVTNETFFQQSRERLQEQAISFGESAASVAADAGAAVGAKVGDLVESAKSSLHEMTDSAATQVAEAGHVVKNSVSSAADAARRTAHDVKREIGNAAGTVRGLSESAGQAAAQTAQNISDAASIIPQQVSGMAADAWQAGKQLNHETRDKVLLGVAGLAVAAALGMAYQKRALEEIE